MAEKRHRASISEMHERKAKKEFFEDIHHIRVSTAAIAKNTDRLADVAEAMGRKIVMVISPESDDPMEESQ